MDRRAAELKAQNLEMSWRVIRATILIMTKSLLNLPAEVFFLALTEADVDDGLKKGMKSIVDYVTGSQLSKLQKSTNIFLL